LNKPLTARLAQLAHLPAPLRILAFLLLLGCCWLPLAGFIALWSRNANQTTIWTMALLFMGFLLLMQRWGRWLYQEPQIFRTYGLGFGRDSRRELLLGLGTGLACLMLMFGLYGGLGWLDWQQPSGLGHGLGRIALEGLLVAAGVALAEELVFRGWILDELERDYRPPVALWISSLCFAVLHFIKPLPEVIRTLPQFPGLLLLGLILVWMKRSTQSQRRSSDSLITRPGRLALPIGLHAGLIWGYYLVDVGQLAELNQAAPEWLTGIDGNPLAGVIGLLCLGGLAFYWRRQAIQV
jgi:hypothetical protein